MIYSFKKNIPEDDDGGGGDGAILPSQWNKYVISDNESMSTQSPLPLSLSEQSRVNISHSNLSTIMFQS